MFLPLDTHRKTLTRGECGLCGCQVRHHLFPALVSGTHGQVARDAALEGKIALVNLPKMMKRRTQYLLGGMHPSKAASPMCKIHVCRACAAKVAPGYVATSSRAVGVSLNKCVEMIDTHPWPTFGITEADVHAQLEAEDRGVVSHEAPASRERGWSTSL